MGKTASNKPSKPQAENFHVLPKRDAQKEQGATPTPSSGTGADIERDVEAGNSGGDRANTQVNQPL